MQTERIVSYFAASFSGMAMLVSVYQVWRHLRRNEEDHKPRAIAISSSLCLLIGLVRNITIVIYNKIHWRVLYSTTVLTQILLVVALHYLLALVLQGAGAALKKRRYGEKMLRLSMITSMVLMIAFAIPLIVLGKLYMIYMFYAAEWASVLFSGVLALRAGWIIRGRMINILPNYQVRRSSLTTLGVMNLFGPREKKKKEEMQLSGPDDLGLSSQQLRKSSNTSPQEKSEGQVLEEKLDDAVAGSTTCEESPHLHIKYSVPALVTIVFSSSTFITGYFFCRMCIVVNILLLPAPL
mmetsp:Transcript_28330/g.46078  ORF Transcript_28330/g.46078 Transcript_28330/m.46078 type:complete len:295 (+) Transcript_28330:64-948(+)